MIDEMYGLICKNGLKRYFSPGNPISRKFDYFSGRIGNRLVRPTLSIEKTWSSDNLSTIVANSDVLGTAFVRIFDLGIVKNVSRQGFINLRAGNVSNLATVFKDVYFIVRIESMEVFREYGYFYDKKMFRFRSDGGEKIEAIIYAPTGITIGLNDFFYIDLELHYEPEKYLITKEKGE